MSQFLEYLKMAVANIRANKMRSLLTMLGIIIGISSVILIMSVGNGAKNIITDEMADIGINQIAIYSYDDTNSYDITQETFLKFMKYGTSYQRNNLKGYLLTIARNLCFDYQQRKKEAGKNLRSYEAENENGSLKISANTQNIYQYPDICGTDKMKEMEDYLYLKGLLNRLSQEVREVIILRAYEELKFKDIAKMMNCSLSTAKSRYRIGIQQMKNMIKEGD